MSRRIFNVRPAGQTADEVAADWDRIAQQQTAGQQVATPEEWGAVGGTTGVNPNTNTGQFSLQQTTPSQPGFSMTGAQVASIINTVLGGTVSLATAQINSDRARDIAETNAATLQAIARIRADIAANPNSAQTAVLQSQLQALTAFAQQRDMFRDQQQQWLKYALFGVVGLAVLGGGAYLLLSSSRSGAPSRPRRRHY